MNETQIQAIAEIVRQVMEQGSTDWITITTGILGIVGGVLGFVSFISSRLEKSETRKYETWVAAVYRTLLELEQQAPRQIIRTVDESEFAWAVRAVSEGFLAWAKYATAVTLPSGKP